MISEENAVGLLFIVGAVLGAYSSTAVFLPANTDWVGYVVRLPLLVLAMVIFGAIWSFLLASFVQTAIDIYHYVIGERHAK